MAYVCFVWSVYQTKPTTSMPSSRGRTTQNKPTKRHKTDFLETNVGSGMTRCLRSTSPMAREHAILPLMRETPSTMEICTRWSCVFINTYVYGRMCVLKYTHMDTWSRKSVMFTIVCVCFHVECMRKWTHVRMYACTHTNGITYIKQNAL